MKLHAIIPIVVIAVLILGGCMLKPKVMDGDGMVGHAGYTHISQEEAKEMMKKEDGHVIVDVRREDEYSEGHIPGAVLIPNESINGEKPEELPDLNQIILVYCRSGNRSKQASQKLADMGYTNVYEFGGINEWTGDVVTDDEESFGEKEDATLSFESFDGGGPSYNLVFGDPELVTYTSKVKYAKADHEKMTGAGYTITYIFTGKKAGTTKLTVEERSPIGDNVDWHYKVVVDENLHVEISE